MSVTTITARFRAGGVYITPTSVTLSDAAGVYGVRRTDTLAVVVDAGTPMVAVSTGVYTYQFEDPGEHLVYEYVVTAVIAGVTYRQSGTVQTATATEGALTTLEGLLVPRVGGCPIELVRQDIRAMFVEFCRQTELWRTTLTLATVADQAYYALAVPSNTHLLKLKSVKLNDLDMACEPMSGASTGVTLLAAPSTTGDTLSVDVVVLPLRTRTTAPLWILNRFGAVIAKGAESSLKAMSNVPWSDPAGAEMAWAQWQSGVTDARIEALGRRGNTIMLPIPNLGG